MFSRNPLLLRDGFAPAADVARCLSKSLSTVHRMVTSERAEGVRDGAALYVKLDPLIALYTEEGNQAMADELRRLKATFAAQARKRLTRTAPANVEKRREDAALQRARLR